jgi:hypothetical protein
MSSKTGNPAANMETFFQKIPTKEDPTKEEA